MTRKSKRDDTEQCAALTNSGDRCSRQAEVGGFCYQHDVSDPIADEARKLTDQGMGYLNKMNEQLAELEGKGIGLSTPKDIEDLEPRAQLLMAATRLEKATDDLDIVLESWRPESRDGSWGYD